MSFLYYLPIVSQQLIVAYRSEFQCLSFFVVSFFLTFL